MTTPEVDVLLVRASATAGHRRGEEETISALADLGFSTAQTTPDYRRVAWLQFTMPLIDLSQALVMRRATSRACRATRPRALIYMTSVSALLEPRARLERGGIRYDALTRENRPGWRGALQRPLETRSIGIARALLPRAISNIPGRSDLVELPLPTPVAHSGAVVERPGPDVVCYAGDPAKKGLDTMVLAWSRTRAATGTRLLVAGIEENAGLRFLRRRGIEVPPTVTWIGSVPTNEFRDLARRASAYLAASRYEDFGIAQLEALVDGTPLVTIPSGGPYEALGIVTDISPELVASTGDADALSAALEVALGWDDERRSSFRSAAAARMQEYSPEAMRGRLRKIMEVLLPADVP